MRPPRPDRAAVLVLLAATLLAACSAPEAERAAVYQRPGGDPATAAAPAPAPPIAATPTPARATTPVAGATTVPGATVTTAPPTGTSDKGSRLARPTPIGQIAPEEAPPEK